VEIDCAFYHATINSVPVLLSNKTPVNMVCAVVLAVFHYRCCDISTAVNNFAVVAAASPKLTRLELRCL
jgi:hypothetical protein